MLWRKTKPRKGEERRAGLVGATVQCSVRGTGTPTEKAADTPRLRGKACASHWVECARKRSSHTQALMQAMLGAFKDSQGAGAPTGCGTERRASGGEAAGHRSSHEARRQFCRLAPL